MKKLLLRIFIFSVLLSIANNASAQTLSSEPATISGQWFFSYRTGETGSRPDNEFLVRRGYVTVKKSLTDRLSGRITPDISVDHEGDGEGDLELRLKYCYADVRFDGFGFITHPHVELGLAHRPWSDFEFSINRYRLQGMMFLERYGTTGSADFGAGFFALLGDELDGDYHTEQNARYAGKYGSIALGVYNGGGYHAIEKNNGKTVEGRLSLRPLSAAFPGFQVSYTGAYGKGNTAASPDWVLNAVNGSFEHRHGVATCAFYRGEGDYTGNAVGNDGKSLERAGYSFFCEWICFGGKTSAIARYDSFDYDTKTGAGKVTRGIAGLAYHIDTKTKVLVDYDVLTCGDNSNCDEVYTQLSLEFGF